MIRSLAAALATLATLGCRPAPVQSQSPEARLVPRADSVPTLVVLITVDQLRTDYFDRFGDRLTGGLGRLARGGAFFTNAFHDHAVTETAPGHASTLSGRFPRHTGIIRNAAGVQDPQAPVIGAPELTGASPFRFRGGTLTDWLRRKDPRARALSVSRKDRGAILPLGRAHQSVYWYDPHSGRFTTSTYYADTLPTWVQRFNARGLPASYAGRAWELLLPGGYPEPDSVPVESGGQGYTFPHVVPSDPARAVRVLPEYPFMDEVTLALALDGVHALALGSGPQTDVLAVSLSAADAVGHRYGPDSREVHDQILRLDRALGGFLDSLFALRDSARVVVALTSDHGVAPAPELVAARRQGDVHRVELTALAREFQRALAARGVSPDAFAIDDGLVFLDRAAVARATIDADSLLRAVQRELRRQPGVLRADLVRDLARADTVRDAIARRWLHMIPSDLPVEIVVTLEPYSVWGTYAVGIHGSPHDYDAHVPVIFYGRPFRPGRYTDVARVVDIAPTLAWITATVPSEPLDGRVRWEALR